MKFHNSITRSPERPFVKFKNGLFEGTIEIWRQDTIETPQISIIIPTIDKNRDGYLPELLEQIENQSFRDWEILLVIGDSRQGRAINCGVELAAGQYIVTFDDDTRLGSPDLLEKMVKMIRNHSEIGMAGVANIPPEKATWFVRKVMEQLPRRTSPIVREIVESDLAEHPCAIFPREIFIGIGGENELIPRGLDPYLRAEIRKAGYKVVVLPYLFIHHLPPATLGKFCQQFFRNGKMAAYVNKFYPEFVLELTTTHNQVVGSKRSTPKRIFSYIGRIFKTLLTLKIFYLLSLILYLAGYITGYIFLKKGDG
ncbi:MAG: glycosyltransferase [Candidatus Marinimicrobia bacterium]|nr:glycosyltransferase [Candidatus Neomarinimicrobiota bacterium]